MSYIKNIIILENEGENCFNLLLTIHYVLSFLLFGFEFFYNVGADGGVEGRKFALDIQVGVVVSFLHQRFSPGGVSTIMK